MPSPLPPSSPAGEPPERAALDELIRQARRLRGGVDAVRRGGAEDRHGARGRWERALCELAVAELDEVGGRLRELRAGAGGTATEAVPAGSAEWNLLTDDVLWSAEVFAFFGRAGADGPLSLDELPSWVLAEDQPALTAAVTDTLVDGSPFDVEFRVVRPDGTVRSLHMAGEPELDAEGDTACLWAVLRDVSALRRSEEAVRDSRENLLSDRGQEWAVQGLAARLPETLLPRWRGEGREAGEPAARGLETASHYFPSARSTLVGGAWFDAPALGDDDTMLTVGELTGSGVAAVSGMAMLLGAVRGMALADVGPGALIGHLEELLRATAQPALGGAVCARYHRSSGELAWSQVGTGAALLFRGGTCRRLRSVAESGTGPAQHTVRLEPGDVLVLHTEGLTGSDADGTTAADRLPGLGPRLGAAATSRECLDAVVAACAGTRDQDACVLVARVPG